MIINIRVTEAAIEHLQRETGLDEEAAGELAQMVLSLSQISGKEDPKPRILLARIIIAWFNRSIKGIDERISDSVYEATKIFGSIKEMEDISRGKIPEAPEGEGSADNLYKTAFYMVKYYNEVGGSRFRARFGSLEVLEVCRKIVAEGEENPHPWE